MSIGANNEPDSIEAKRYQLNTMWLSAKNLTQKIIDDINSGSVKPRASLIKELFTGLTLCEGFLEKSEHLEQQTQYNEEMEISYEDLPDKQLN